MTGMANSRHFSWVRGWSLIHVRDLRLSRPSKWTIYESFIFSLMMFCGSIDIFLIGHIR